MCIVQGLKNGAEIIGVFERHEMDPVYARIVGIVVSYQQQILQLSPDPVDGCNVGL